MSDRKQRKNARKTLSKKRFEKSVKEELKEFKRLKEQEKN